MELHKLSKITIAGVTGLMLLVAGSTPTVRNTIQGAKNYIEAPESHANSGYHYVKVPNNESFSLSKKVTSKTFSETDDNDAESAVVINRVATKRADNYLRHVKNLNDYHVHISHSISVGSSSSKAQAITTITFIRKN